MISISNLFSRFEIKNPKDEARSSGLHRSRAAIHPKPGLPEPHLHHLFTISNIDASIPHHIATELAARWKICHHGPISSCKMSPQVQQIGMAIHMPIFAYRAIARPIISKLQSRLVYTRLVFQCSTRNRHTA